MTPAPESLALADALASLTVAQREYREYKMFSESPEPGVVYTRLPEFEAEYHKAVQHYADAVVAVVRKDNIRRVNEFCQPANNALEKAVAPSDYPNIARIKS